MAPSEKVFLGHSVMPSWLSVDLCPGGTVLHEGKPGSSEYSPSLSQLSQDDWPPAEALPKAQSSHSVLVVAVLEVLMNFPAPHVEAVRQPTAPPLSEYFPSLHMAHSLAPPTEYVPAAQFSTS